MKQVMKSLVVVTRVTHTWGGDVENDIGNSCVLTYIEYNNKQRKQKSHFLGKIVPL